MRVYLGHELLVSRSFSQETHDADFPRTTKAEEQQAEEKAEERMEVSQVTAQ